MAKNLIIPLDDTLDPRIVAGFIKAHHYRTNLEDGTPNPENPRQFMLRRIKEYIRDSVIQAEAMDAAEQSRQAAWNKANTEIVIG